MPFLHFLEVYQVELSIEVCLGILLLNSHGLLDELGYDVEVDGLVLDTLLLECVIWKLIETKNVLDLHLSWLEHLDISGILFHDHSHMASYLFQEVVGYQLH